MKKQRRWISMVLVMCLALTVLVSCGGTQLSGTYRAEFGESSYTYTFEGDKVQLQAEDSLGIIFTVSGTYKIEGDKITTSFDGDGVEVELYGGTYDFENSEDGKTVKIGLLTYNKQ